jgi:tetratricopeptide (TPR) repeat protein
LRIANDLDDLGRTDEAIAGLDKLIAAEPDNYDALYTRGNIQRAHERWAEAADSYTRALARIPSPGKRHWTVFYFRGIAYERSDQWPKAEADFKKALRLQPDQPAVLNYLGYSWIEKGMNLDKALAMVKKAVDLRPNDGYIVDSLGWAYYHLGDYAEATKYLERAVALRPEDATINDHLGDAYWRVGRKLEAKFQWAHARDSKPDPKELKVILKKLSDGLPPLQELKPAANGKAPDRT